MNDNTRKQDVKVDDIERIAAIVRSAGELLDAHGALTLELLSSWRSGPRSPNLDPDAGGWRYEQIEHVEGAVETVPVPSDSTGEAALRHDVADTNWTEMQALLNRIASDSARLRDIVASVVPNVGGLLVATPEEWCSNHLRIQQCEPRHRGDLCRFCYEFKLTRKRLPPPSILGLRHRYGRVTSKQIDDALARESRHDDSLDRVNDIVQRGRRVRPVAAEKRTTPVEPTPEERQAAIEDRRRNRLRTA